MDTIVDSSSWKAQIVKHLGGFDCEGLYHGGRCPTSLAGTVTTTVATARWSLRELTENGSGATLDDTVASSPDKNSSSMMRCCSCRVTKEEAEEG